MSDQLKASKQDIIADACKTGDIKKIQELIDNGIKVNRHFTTEGLFPIHVAALNGHKEICQILLNNGDEANKSTLSYEEHETPLFFAVKGRQEEMVAFLLDKGANVDHENNDKETPLFGACSHGFKKIFDMLVEAGADLNHKNAHGETPLFFAAYSGSKEIVSFLIEKGADVNQEDSIKHTPIFKSFRNASICGFERMMQEEPFLGEKKIKFDEFLKENLKLEEIVAFLIEKGADVNHKAWCGVTPLIYASGRGHKSMVKILLEKGADPNVHAEVAETSSLDLAFRHGHIAVFFILLNNGAKVNEHRMSRNEGYRNWVNVCRANNLLLCARKFCKDPSFFLSDDFLPLDLFKYIWNLSRVQNLLGKFQWDDPIEEPSYEEAKKRKVEEE